MAGRSRRPFYPGPPTCAGSTPGLFVALAVVTALVGFYAGMSTSTPQALADPLADPAGSSVDVTRTDGIDRGAGAQGTGYLTIAAIDIGSN